MEEKNKGLEECVTKESKKERWVIEIPSCKLKKKAKASIRDSFDVPFFGVVYTALGTYCVFTENYGWAGISYFIGACDFYRSYRYNKKSYRYNKKESAKNDSEDCGESK